MADAADRPLVKGAAIREFLFWYESRYDRRYLTDVIARLPPELSAGLQVNRAALGLLASAWYDVAIVHAILDSVTEGRSKAQVSAILREGSEFVVRRMMQGVFQFLFKMVGSPGLYAKHIQRAWRTLHTTGTRTMEIDPAGLAYSTISDWPGHHPALCELATETMRAVFMAMGCRDVSVQRMACVSAGAPECRAIVRFRDS